MGFVGTWAGRICICRLGLLRAGVAAISFQVWPCTPFIFGSTVQCLAKLPPMCPKHVVVLEVGALLKLGLAAGCTTSGSSSAVQNIFAQACGCACIRHCRAAWRHSNGHSGGGCCLLSFNHAVAHWLMVGLLSTWDMSINSCGPPLPPDGQL